MAAIIGIELAEFRPFLARLKRIIVEKANEKMHENPTDLDFAETGYAKRHNLCMAVIGNQTHYLELFSLVVTESDNITHESSDTILGNRVDTCWNYVAGLTYAEMNPA